MCDFQQLLSFFKYAFDVRPGQQKPRLRLGALGVAKVGRGTLCSRSADREQQQKQKGMLMTPVTKLKL